MFDLTGKSALVTGSSQGIGKEIAKLLSKMGARVFVHASKDINKAKDVCDEMKNAVPVIGDLSEENCADTLYAQTGDVDILVLNASVQIRNRWDKITQGEFDTQINVNLKALFFLFKNTCRI